MLQANTAGKKLFKQSDAVQEQQQRITREVALLADLEIVAENSKHEIASMPHLVHTMSTPSHLPFSWPLKPRFPLLVEGKPRFRRAQQATSTSRRKSKQPPRRRWS